jgi:hypothetical protein
MSDSIDRKPFDIPYLSNVSRSNFYPKVREVIEREMPIDVGKTVECNLQKPGGYELAVDVVIKPGEEFQSDRGYRDSTRFPARIRAAATALRDSGNFGLYSISHRESVLTIKQLRDDFAPTADDVQLERATKQLLAHGTVREPVGIERPTKVEITQATFVRDPRVRAYVLAAAKGFCEACANRAPFSTDDGSPFLEVHHVKMLSDGGSDKITNAVALCPNCHRRLHHSADREFFARSIYQRVQRLIRE